MTRMICLVTLKMSLSSLVMAELTNAEADFPTETVKVTSPSGGLESIYFNTGFCIRAVLKGA